MSKPAITFEIGVVLATEVMSSSVASPTFTVWLVACTRMVTVRFQSLALPAAAPESKVRTSALDQFTPSVETWRPCAPAARSL